jgi:SAM-dependent methyltransferase
MTEAVARVPGSWRYLRGPMSRFFADAAPGWDERVRPDDAEHLAPLVQAVDRLDLSPQRILDVGTGTGAAALWLARRFEQAEVLGIDVAPEMIERARAKAIDRVNFEVADTRAAARRDPFDLVVHLNCPVLFDAVAEALAPGGTTLVVASHGRRTPFYTSHGALRRGFRRAGLEVIDEGQAGEGTWLAATSR